MKKTVNNIYRMKPCLAVNDTEGEREGGARKKVSEQESQKGKRVTNTDEYGNYERNMIQ